MVNILDLKGYRMRRLSIMLMLTLGLLVGCVSPAELTMPNNSLASPSEALQILSDTSLQPAVNVDYGVKLKASISDASWRVTNGILPAGSIRLNSSGEFSGQATKLGEIGTFTVEASSGSQVVSKQFSFRVVDVVWAYPVGVQVDKFHPGARAEYTIKVHNDDSVIQEHKRVTTDATDTPNALGLISIPISLNQQLHDANITNILSVKSDNPSEQLTATSYKTGSLTIDGFLPLSSRTIDISYVADAIFSASYEMVDLDVGKMVTISDTSFVLGPHETKAIDVALDMPSDYQTDAKEFSFRILTGRSVSTQGTLTVAAVNAVTWHVTMR